MHYQYDPDRDDPVYEPWEQGEYRTGATKPPKNHRSLIAVLFVCVIILCGVVSVLGVMNIRLFQQVRTPEAADSLPIMFSNDTQNTFPSYDASAEPAQETNPLPDLIQSATSPSSVENISQSGGLPLQDIYQKNIPSVVSIACKYAGGSSSGTGVILSSEGYIVTNSHVIEDAQQIEVFLSDGRTLTADLVGMDVVSDLAVLFVEADALIAAELGDSTALRVGDTVVAIGDPLGIELRGTMTDGIVSAINRDVDVGGRTMNLIQTNAALNSGNSGGPLINCYGQVIGINTMKIGDTMSSAGVEGLGFAIPSTTVQDIVNQLIQNGYVSGRPDLGISGEGISEFYQFYYRLPRGLYITDVKTGSSAEEVGLEPGDILISIDDTAITSSHILETLLYGYAPGDTVTAIVYRAGRQYKITLTVGEATG